MHSKMTARIADGQESRTARSASCSAAISASTCSPRSSLRHPSLLAGRPLLSYRVYLQRYQNYGGRRLPNPGRTRPTRTAHSVYRVSPNREAAQGA